MKVMKDEAFEEKKAVGREERKVCEATRMTGEQLQCMFT
jgi:hypothetical protein